VPIAAFLGDRDEFLDRPARAVIDTLGRNATRARSFTGAVVPGAPHGFQKREGELAELLARWIDSRRAR
jgi:hypothetical protein